MRTELKIRTLEISTFNEALNKEEPESGEETNVWSHWN